MADPPEKNNRPGMAPAPLPGDPLTSCFYCRKPEAMGTEILGGWTSSGGTKIRVCAEGTGCRDGRVRHGPPHNVEPHWPDEECPVCASQRKIEANRSPHGGRGGSGNRSRRHR